MKTRHIAAALLACTATAAQAAPFATRYQGVVQSTDFAGIAPGTGFSVTLIADNGGASATGQTWPWQTFLCAIVRVDGGAITFASGGTAVGSMATDGSGALTGIFTSASASLMSAAGSSGSIVLNPAVAWNLNGTNPVLVDADGTAAARALNGDHGGVSMDFNEWSAPQRVMGECDDTPYAAPAAPNATPVPVLGPVGLGLMAGLVGAAVFVRHRKKI